jgi:transcriptional regulator with XRE-family HTH domain
VNNTVPTWKAAIMTKKLDNSFTSADVKNGAPMDLLKPRYTPAQRALADKMRSRLNVARAILMARLDQGLSQEEVGKRAGTKQSRISELEASKGNVRFDTLDRVAGALDMMIDLVPRRATVEVIFEHGGYTVVIPEPPRNTFIATTATRIPALDQAFEMAS